MLTPKTLTLVKIYRFLIIGLLNTFISCQYYDDSPSTPPTTSITVPLDSTKPSFTLSTWVKADKHFEPNRWEERLTLYQSIGITTILVQGDTSSLSKLIPLASNHNIKVQAWLKVFNQPKNKTTQQHPEWYAVNRLGQNSLKHRPYVRYYEWLSPFHPAVRAYIKEKVSSYCTIEGLNAIHLDYVRYPDAILGAALQKKYQLKQDQVLAEYDYDYHPIARAAFQKTFGVDPIQLEQPELSAEWRQFRMNAITSLVNELKIITQQANIQLTAAVFPFPTLARQMVRQAWDDWQLDAAYPMLYHNFYEQTIPWIGFGVEQGVQEVSYPIHAGVFIPAFEEAKTLIQAIKLAKEKGAQGICLFTADHLNEQQLDALKQYIKQTPK